MSEQLIAQLGIYMVVLLFAISAHEAAHAWMSYKFGDDTAYLLGRVTLNPIAHTDPVGTLLIPIAGFIFGAIGGGLGAIPLIGWGKPCPVNPLKWRNKNTANVMVSIAGILANILIASSVLVVLKIVQYTGLLADGGALAALREPIALLLTYGIIMNASLAVFNLMPFPPLDGSKILATFLPASMQDALDALERYGFLILMAAIYFGLFRAIFSPVAWLIGYLIRL